jgi:hypothetical protein
MMMYEGKTYYSIQETSAKLGVPTSQITAMIETGLIDYEPYGCRRYLVEEQFPQIKSYALTGVVNYAKIEQTRKKRSVPIADPSVVVLGAEDSI